MEPTRVGSDTLEDNILHTFYMRYLKDEAPVLTCPVVQVFCFVN